MSQQDKAYYVVRSGQDAIGTRDTEGITPRHPSAGSEADLDRRDAIIDAQVNLPERLGMSPFDPDFFDIHENNCSQPNVTPEMHEIIDKEISDRYPSPHGAMSFQNICRMSRGLPPIEDDATSGSRR